MTALVDNQRLIDQWFPCAAVDEACGNPAGSGKNEKAIFPWFASRPIAQARAAVACALLGDDPATRQAIDEAVRGSRSAIDKLAEAVAANHPAGRPVVLDVFSGRGIIPLEAARLGAVAVGLDLSPVATLAGRILADYPPRDWSAEPSLPWTEARSDGTLQLGTGRARLIADLRTFLAEVGSRVRTAVAPYYPANPDGSYPWGYMWAISILCDGCNGRFPLIGNMVLRHPYTRTGDHGQALHLEVDGDNWRPMVIDGTPDQTPTYSSAELPSGKKRKGKSARCPFCQHVHSLEAVKAKGFNGEYRDELLVATDTEGETKKVFRTLRPEEQAAAAKVDLSGFPAFGPYPAVPDEQIAAGNVHTVMASGYGYRTFGSLMCERQTLQFVETARAIRTCHSEMRRAGLSPEYSGALASFAGALLVRKLKYSTRGANLQPFGKSDGSGNNNLAVRHVFSKEAVVAFQFDFFETGPGSGPGTWASLSETGLKPLETHIRGLRGRPARFRQVNAMALPYRDASVDVVVTDPPYYDMIEYADASDLFHVWLKRILFDIEPDLFGDQAAGAKGGLQNKDDEIIVRRVHEPGRVRHDQDFYEASLSKAFTEARRVLRPNGHLVVVFGHSDPDAWRRLLGALHDAGFVVTSSWPSRTESANTGVASIKVTVTIGCKLAPKGRRTATAAQVDREVMSVVKGQVRTWAREGLALSDQMMAAYGPAMEVYGRYAKVLLTDGSEAPLDRYLTLARKAVREATALRLDALPLETFDALTRLAVFWLRLYGRTNVPKGEARFMAQADNLRLEDVRDALLAESTAGFRLLVTPPARVGPDSPAFDVARAVAGALAQGGTEAAASVLARSERAPDDEQLWAVVGELVAQLPPDDATAKALTAVQRNTSAIQNLAKGIAAAQADDDPAHRPTLFATDQEAER
jgi:adenine-specific DNA methylase